MLIVKLSVLLEDGDDGETLILLSSNHDLIPLEVSAEKYQIFLGSDMLS